jgi:hypothetical protein
LKTRDKRTTGPERKKALLRIGIEAGRNLPTYATLEEVGRFLGCTKQEAYFHVHVALGRLVYRLRKEIKEP